ncbi:DUF4340 domain-containing protein [Candidatus Peregrinibacteria bacterium]|nr:DUF4340 domain-containing protein [Candidatus Peregrinibacteria bacterium]
MKKHTNLILAAIFAVLLVLSTYSLWGLYVFPKTENSGVSEITLGNTSLSDVDTIVISDTSSEKSFTKKDGAWNVNEFLASESELKKIFDSFSSREVQDLASKNPNNHEKFGVAEGKSIVFAMEKKGEVLWKFLIGNPGKEPQTFYIRKGGSDNVYLAKGNLREILSRNVDAWRDKKIVEIDRNTIAKVILEKGKDILTIEKSADGSTWAVSDGNQQKAFDGEKVQKFFDALSPLEASGFLNEDQKKEFNEAKEGKITLQFLSQNEEKKVVIRLLEKDGSYFGNVEGSDTYYSIYTYALFDVLLDAGKIFAIPSPDSE